MPVSVRRAEKADAGKIAEFSVALADQHFGYDELRFSRVITIDGAAAFYRDRIDAEDAAVFVAAIDENVVGFAYMEYEPIIYAELATNVAWLHDIYVDQSERTAGIGMKLIEAVASAAKKLGAEKLLLSVAVKNDLAQKVFEKAGFRRTMSEMTLNLK